MQKYYCNVFHNAGYLLGVLEVYSDSEQNASFLFNRMIVQDDCWLGDVTAVKPGEL